MASQNSFSPALTLAFSLFVIVGVTACDREDLPSPSDTLAVNSGSEIAENRGVPEISPAKLPMQGEWRLIAIDQRELSGGGSPTIVFGDEGDCWGSTGVNEFHTKISLENIRDGRLKVGNAAVTRKMGPPEAMALENLFLERFESANSFDVKGDTLQLISGDDQNLTFQRVIH